MSSNFNALLVVNAYVTKLATVVQDTIASKGRKSWTLGMPQIGLAKPHKKRPIWRTVFAYSLSILQIYTFPNMDGLTSNDFTILIISLGSIMNILFKFHTTITMFPTNAKKATTH